MQINLSNNYRSTINFNNMKNKKMVFMHVCLLLNAGCAQDSTKTKAEKLEWHLSMHSYTFICLQ
jgi:hypothetical protein